MPILSNLRKKKEIKRVTSVIIRRRKDTLEIDVGT